MKKNVLLIDFNNLLFRILYSKDVDIHSEAPSFVLWRYLVYDAVYTAIKANQVIEVVLAIDDKNSWRKSYFSRYKESRKGQRDKTGIDFNAVFRIINNFIRDIKHCMPFKVLRIRSTEADDIIGELALGLDHSCIIVSNDEDYTQLISDRVKVWNPSKRKFLEFPINLGNDKKPILINNGEEFLNFKILTGQAKDDIFNIKTPNDWGKSAETLGKRKPGLGPVTAQKIIEGGLDGWVRAEGLEAELKRNKILIDFRRIPKTICNRIWDEYDNYNYPPVKNIRQFFEDNNMGGYLENYHSVENLLLELY